MGALNLPLLIFSITLWSIGVFADGTPTSTSSSSASGTAPAFPTMSGQDGVGVPDGGVGSQDTGSAAGASGSDQGSFSLSTGAIVGISVTVGVVVIGITVVWALWFLAKRRNWNIRESLRRASRRLTGRRDTGAASRSSRANRRGTVMLKSPPANGSRTPAKKDKDIDLEKGKHSGPKPGWLAEEKERSRSSSREDDKSKRSGK